MTYVKLIRKNCTHHGLVLRPGLNCLLPHETFDPRPECGPGGLYFCEEKDVENWCFLYKDEIGYIATVRLCADSKLVKMKHKLKTDRFILGQFQPITAEQLIPNIGWLLKWIAQPTHELCLAAVQQDGWALSVVPKQFKTFAVCLAAVRHTGCALQHVPEATPVLCYAAVRQDGWALQFVPDSMKTESLCLDAFRQDERAAQFIPDTIRRHPDPIRRHISRKNITRPSTLPPLNTLPHIAFLH